MILDIKTLATSLTDEVEQSVKKFATTPSLTIIMVWNNSASDVYVKNKIKTCKSVGIYGNLIHLESSTTAEEIKKIIQTLNQDDSVDAILVQSPLPDHVNEQEIFDCIDPKKDVDGFSSINMARLYGGDETGLVPGTPKWIMKIIEQELWNIEGKDVVVIGKSTIVGKPLSMLLLHAGATVTICHSRTKNLAEKTKNADIVISAAGKKHLIKADMIKPESLVIDVGINVEENWWARKIFWDCDTENIGKIAHVTPVPGGVGPMTIALLLSNVLLAHRLQWKN